ncbi:MAG: hypothetical protein FH756_06130 [Firmicutes bacterium]|nr:hypothetical protein [Bacillota bacterium]
MTYPLTRSIRETAAVADGWQVGTLVIHGNTYHLETDSRLIDITEDHTVEVMNGNNWQAIGQDNLAKKTAEGWPLLAGMKARVKHNGR